MRVRGRCEGGAGVTWQTTTIDTHPVLYTTAPVPDTVLARVPHHRNNGLTVARHTFDAWRELTLAGQTVPHPIEHYDWPGPWTPRDNQRHTARFLATHHRAACLNGMRTGKTLSALWAADYLQREGVVGSVLIVAPKSTLESIWERSILTTFGHRKKWCVLTGTRERKQEDVRRPYDFWIVNPDSLHLLVGHCEPSLVIVDEATCVKNPQSRRWKALHKLLGDRPCWMLTATPTQHSPEDALGLVRILHDKFISQAHWRGLVMYKVNQFKWLPKRDAEQTVARWLQPSIRYTLADCGDVPSVQKEYIPVPQTKKQRDLAEKLVQAAVADLESGEQITAANAGALLSKLLQVQGGGVYIEHEGAREIRRVPADPFYEAVADYAEAADTPVVVFAPFRAVAGELARRLDAPLIWGDTPAGERTQIINDFQDGKHHVLVAVPETMSHGVTLSAASYVLWVLPTFKAETYAQANGRVLEADSTKHIVISHLVPSQVAQKRYDALESKERLQDTVLQLLQGESE